MSTTTDSATEAEQEAEHNPVEQDSEASESQPSEMNSEESHANEQTDEQTEAWSFIASVSVLKSFFNAVSAVADECVLDVETDLITTTMIDRANVALANPTFYQDAFEEFSGVESNVGVDITRVLDIISIGSPDDLAKVSFDPETRIITIVIDNLEYNLATIDPESVREAPSISEFEEVARFTIEIDDLDRGVDASDMVAEHVEFSFTDDDSFVIHAEGDTDDVELDLGEDELVDIHQSESGTVLLGMEYVNSILKTIPNNSEVTMEFRHEMPVNFFVDLEDGAGKVQYMIAPRIRTN